MDKQQREYIHHLMLQYSDAMVRLTYRRVGDWHLAEDLVQETFLTACCKSERVCGHKKPVAWLFETLNNLTLRESRRFYHTEVSIEDIAESYELTELPVACHIPMGLLGMPEHERPAVDLIARLMGEDLGNQRLQQSSNLQLNPVFGIIRCDDIQLVIVEIPPGTEW